MNITSSMRKQLNMVAVVNEPFFSVQIVCRSPEVISNVNKFVIDHLGDFIFVHREYDGSERYIVILPTLYNFVPVLNDFLKFVDKVNNDIMKGGIVL